ncbi:hypothetical protein [Sorangium sp. So ce861]|uniref:hypothetical protein n=1 Tax=Sorangium sp. So ce861 TaxID=3133323 RepID=UPI003F5D5C28
MTLDGPQGASESPRSEANLNAIVNVPDVPVSNTGLTATYPANSITPLVIPGAWTPRARAPRIGEAASRTMRGRA